MKLENDFTRLDEFYRRGGELEDMPDDLRRFETIFKFSAPLVERGYISAKDLGAKIFMRFGSEFDITQKTCYAHALNCFSYYSESINQTNTPKIIRARLTKLLWKLIDFHYEFTLPKSPIQGQKAIDMAMKRIIEINPGILDVEDNSKISSQKTTFVLSADSGKFPELNIIPELRLAELVDKFTKDFALTEDERNTLIRKDLNNGLL